MNLLSSLLKYTADQIAALRTKDTSQDTVVSGINTRLTTAEGDIDSLEAQFTTVVAAVTTDTEVTNIRVGDDGVTYGTAGNAVRKQFSNVKMLYDAYEVLQFDTIDNEYPAADGTFPSYSDWKRSDYIPVDGVTLLYFDSTRQSIDNMWYDEDKTPITTFNVGVGTKKEVLVPAAAAYMVVSNKASDFYERIYKAVTNLAVQSDVALLANDGHFECEYEVILNKGFNRNNGTFPSESGWNITSFIPVKGGETVYVSNMYERTSYNGFYKSDYSYIEPFDVEINSKNEITVPVDAAYIVLSNRNSSFDFKVWTEAKGLVTPRELEDLDSKKIGSDISHNFSILNERVTQSGVIVGSNGQARTDFIPCSEGQSIEWLGWSFVYQGNPSMCCLAFYDSKKNFISGITKIGDETASKKGIINTVAPSGTAYVIGSTNGDIVGEYVKLSYSLSDIIGTQNAVTDDEVAHTTLYARHIVGGTEPLTLLHFSDLHGDESALQRIVSGGKGLADDMICTGDIVPNTAEQISSWWDEDVMTCIGNHDSASYSGGAYNWTALSMSDRDTYYIAPFESNWGITHTSGTSYYYKDYATQKVRLIVMDGMLYNDNGAEAAAQTAWLSNLLSDAITNSYHALIAIHAPHGGATAKDCSFSRYNQGVMPTWADCNTPQTVIDAVTEAINNGLKFIGYIVGHTHQDNIWKAVNDGTQLMYCVTCANVASEAQWKDSDQFRDNNNDAYNLVTVDTAHTLVKIIRGGGADIDDHMRTRKAICFNYSNGEVVGEVL